MALLSVITLAGCIPCLHAIYTDKDLVFDSGLVGVWDYPDASAAPDGTPSAEGKGYWEFTKLGEKSYRLVLAEPDGKSGVFETHLVKLGGATFLDLYPVHPDLPSPTDSDFYKLHLLRMHTFMAVERIGDALRYRLMDAEWLQGYLERHPHALRHEKLQDSRPNIVLTASTKELQAFLARHVSTEGAFTEWKELKRRKGEH